MDFSTRERATRNAQRANAISTLNPVKLLPLAAAVDRFVPDGASVALGMALESLIPFAAGHELIRRQRRDLELIGPISDMLFDQLIGAGCVRRITAAWVGNVSAGLGHNYRRAVEQAVPAPLELEEHSNFSVGLALQAAAMGVPYLPTRTLLGSDLARRNPRITPAGVGVLHVAALQPDVAILHVQRADVEGHAHCWGNLGLSKEAGLAARRVILVAEEIVPPDVILSDPNRILLPPHKVAAVVHESGGAHPSPVQGYYGRDHAAFGEYHRGSRSRDAFLSWLQEWVFDVADRRDYIARLGSRFEALRPRAARLAAAVDYA
jgi:glutaconate CoA-transferase subunit A